MLVIFRLYVIAATLASSSARSGGFQWQPYLNHYWFTINHPQTKSTTRYLLYFRKAMSWDEMVELAFSADLAQMMSSFTYLSRMNGFGESQGGIRSLEWK